MFIGCNFPNIIFSERKVCFKSCKAVFITLHFFKQSVFWDRVSICGGNIFIRKQSEFYIQNFIVHAECKFFINTHDFRKIYLHFLPFVLKGSRFKNNTFFLSVIGQFHNLRFSVQSHAIGCFLFDNSISAEIQFFALCDALIVGYQNCHERVLFNFYAAMNNIFIGIHAKDSTV